MEKLRDAYMIGIIKKVTTVKFVQKASFSATSEILLEQQQAFSCISGTPFERL